jgi:hypothetical protein
MAYWKRALALPALLSLPAGCGTLTPAATPAVAPAARRATSGSLLYLTSGGSVLVYSFPQLKLVGTLHKLVHPAGLCTDAAGNVFVTELEGRRITEYAHGGTAPIARLSDPGAEPIACSVDPTTGNLAVANFAATSFGQGNVAVYAHATGTPTRYATPSGTQWFSVNACGYDASGNLYFAGIGYSGFTIDGELAAGSGRTLDISIAATFTGPGQVQWDGTYITFADRGSGEIYQFAAHGNVLSQVGSVKLKRSGRVDQSWISGNLVVAPQVDGKVAYVYAYPHGGAPAGTIAGLRLPFGATVSTAAAK